MKKFTKLLAFIGVCTWQGTVSFLGGGIPEATAKTAVSPAYTNQLASTQNLNGVYFGLRHGESVPSSQKRVCSTMKNGIDPKNGLTEKGKEEVVQSVTVWIEANKNLIKKYLKKDKLVIVASPFSRTKESADIVADLIQEKFRKILPAKYQGPATQRNLIVVEENLRERSFGKFEGKGNSSAIYDKVWAEDKMNPNQTKWDVESASAVQERATQMIANLEEQAKQANGMLFILVSHGDTLKITQTGFQKQSAAEHCNPNQVKPFKTAEIREFELSSHSTAQK